MRKQQLLDSFKLISAAEKDSRKFHSIIVGDFNFDSTWKKEEAVLTDNGFKDQLHDFFGKEVITMAAKGKYEAWRPDKVVMRDHKGNHKGKRWKVTKAEIVGDEKIAEAG